MELSLKQLQQSVAQLEIRFHREKNENNSILKDHEDQIKELVKDINERLDLAMGACKELKDKIDNLEGRTTRFLAKIDVRVEKLESSQQPKRSLLNRIFGK